MALGCPYVGCGGSFASRPELDRHVPRCRHRKDRCPLCGDLVSRSGLALHLNQMCPMRVIVCSGCQADLLAGEVAGHRCSLSNEESGLLQHRNSKDRDTKSNREDGSSERCCHLAERRGGCVSQLSGKSFLLQAPDPSPHFLLLCKCQQEIDKVKKRLTVIDGELIVRDKTLEKKIEELHQKVEKLEDCVSSLAAKNAAQEKKVEAVVNNLVTPLKTFHDIIQKAKEKESCFKQTTRRLDALKVTKEKGLGTHLEKTGRKQSDVRPEQVDSKEKLYPSRTFSLSYRNPFFPVSSPLVEANSSASSSSSPSSSLYAVPIMNPDHIFKQDYRAKVSSSSLVDGRRPTSTNQSGSKETYLEEVIQSVCMQGSKFITIIPQEINLRLPTSQKFLDLELLKGQVYTCYLAHMVERSCLRCYFGVYKPSEQRALLPWPPVDKVVFCALDALSHDNKIQVFQNLQCERQPDRLRFFFDGAASLMGECRSEGRDRLRTALLIFKSDQPTR